MHSARSLAPLALGLALVTSAASGCGARYSRHVLHDQGGVKVVLRAELVAGETVARGHSHPATIAGVRLAHILSRIDVRFGAIAEDGTQRRPAIATDLLYQLGDLLAEALAKSDPNQEVVVQALRKERTLGIFTTTHVTSFVAWVQDDDLVIHLSRVDQLIPKGEKSEELREPQPGSEVMAFKTLPSEGVVPIAHQAVAVDWRNPVFRSPTHVRVGPNGRVVRRTILMESAEPTEEPEPTDRVLPADPGVLRALADLEETRRGGAITEREYQQQRRDLLRDVQPPGTE